MVEIGDGSLFESVARNPVIQIEQNAKGKLVFLCAFEMPPTFETCLKVSYFPSHSDTFRQKTYGLIAFFFVDFLNHITNEMSSEAVAIESKTTSSKIMLFNSVRPRYLPLAAMRNW